jgi:hypothetical protein
MTESIIGPLFSSHLIEEGAISTLRQWLPTYMEEARAQYGLELPEIKSWGLVADEYDRFAEQALPALVVVAEGIGKGGEPETYGGGWYRASWALGVIVAIQHPDRNKAREIAQIYGAVTRGALLQRRSLGAGGRVAEWLDEGYPFKTKGNRTRAVAENVFLVKQDEVVNWQMGPKGDEPPPVVPADYPEITEVDVDAEVK